MSDTRTFELQETLGLAREGQLHEARRRFERLSREDHREVEHVRLFSALAIELGHPEIARARLRRALKRSPQDAQLHLLLGIALRREGQLAPAGKAFRDALHLEPGWPDAVYNRAVVLEAQGKYDDAETLLREGLRGAPNDADLWNQLGIVLGEQGQADEALQAHRRAAALEPDHDPLAFNLGIELLRAGEYSEGFPLFERRLRFSANLTRPITQAALWRGEPLAGKSILVWNEQGLGDTIFAARWLAGLVDSAEQVYLRCQPPLARWFDQFEGIRRIDTKELPDGLDYHVPALSLPGLAYRSRPEDWRGATCPLLPRLRPIDDPAVAQRLAPGDGPRIGIVWAGNRANPEDARRSLAPRNVLPLLDVPGTRVFNFQFGDDARRVRSGRWVDLSPHLGGFLNTARLMGELDLLISVDTAAAHLAGAHGIPVWTLLGRHADWRWGQHGDTTEWYPTMRLWRCEPSEDWSPLVRRVAEALKSFNPVAKDQP